MKTKEFVDAAIAKHIEKVVSQIEESTARSEIAENKTKNVDRELPEFTFENANAAFEEALNENATGGATGAGSVAVVTNVLGEKGGFSKKDVNKKLSGYGNMLSNGGKVTLPKSKK